MKQIQKLELQTFRSSGNNWSTGALRVIVRLRLLIWSMWLFTTHLDRAIGAKSLGLLSHPINGFFNGSKETKPRISLGTQPNSYDP
jgi:hypothetical protein